MEPTRSRLHAVVRWLPAVLWAAVIFAGSSVPGSRIPGGFSVYGHLAEYAVLAALVVAAQRDGERRRMVFVAIAVCALYGASDEFHQAFVPMRVPDVMDLLTDVIGASAGSLAAVGLRHVGRARTIAGHRPQ